MGVLFRHGLLTSQEQHWVQDMINKYPHAVLLNGILDHDWTEANLSKHPHYGEDCMGNVCRSNADSHMYGIVQSAFGKIYFFQEKSDYDKVCALPDIVIDPQPFMTFLDSSILSKIFK